MDLQPNVNRRLDRMLGGRDEAAPISSSNYAEVPDGEFAGNELLLEFEGDPINEFFVDLKTKGQPVVQNLMNANQVQEHYVPQAVPQAPVPTAYPVQAVEVVDEAAQQPIITYETGNVGGAYYGDYPTQYYNQPKAQGYPAQGANFMPQYQGQLNTSLYEDELQNNELQNQLQAQGGCYDQRGCYEYATQQYPPPYQPIDNSYYENSEAVVPSTPAPAQVVYQHNHPLPSPPKQKKPISPTPSASGSQGDNTTRVYDKSLPDSFVFKVESVVEKFPDQRYDPNVMAAEFPKIKRAIQNEKDDSYITETVRDKYAKIKAGPNSAVNKRRKKLTSYKVNGKLLYEYLVQYKREIEERVASLQEQRVPTFNGYY